MDAPSRLDLYAIGRDYLLQRATKLDPGQVDVLGSDANIFVGSNSVVADTVVKQLIFSTARHFLDGAEGDDLDRLAWDRYGLTRKGASAALGAVDILRPNASAGLGTVAVGTRVATLPGIEYVTTTPAAFGVSDLKSSANVRAVQAGKLTQVAANQIVRFSSAGELFDPSLTVNNPLPTAGGEDAESDDLFRSRIRDFWNTARRGILAAIEFGALTVPGVVSAQAIEALSVGGMPARVVNLYIADSSGVASEALAQQVLAALDDYRAAGIAVIISTSLPFIVDIGLLLSFRAGVDTVTLSSNVAGAVVSFVNTLPVNGTLYTAELKAVLLRFKDDGLIVTDGSIVTPAGDLVPQIGQTLRTTLANITILTP